jgi:hypothetical protein
LGSAIELPAQSGKQTEVVVKVAVAEAACEIIVWAFATLPGLELNL